MAIPNVESSAKSHGAEVALSAGLIALITLILYIPSTRGGFVWDDAMYITGNPMVTASDGLPRFWMTTEAFDYYPLTWSLWWLEWRLWAGSTFGYHVVSIVLHIADTLLVWMILRRLKLWGSWLAALLFAIHPVNVATVAWISEQKNTLSMLFYAIAIFMYLKFDREDRAVWYVLSLASFILALLSKSAVVMLPMALLGCVWWQRGKVRWKDLLRTLPFFVLSLVFGIVTIWFQYNRVLRGHPARSDSFLSRLLGAGWAAWFYLYKAILPFNLIAIYPKWSIDTTVLASYVPLVLLTGCFTIFYWKRQTWGRPLLFAFGYFTVTLFPVMGFFDQNFYQYSLVADPWQYYSIVGVIALAVAAGTSIFRRTGRWGPYAGWFAGAAVTFALGTTTWTRTRVYADSQTLWQDVVAKNPDSWAGHNNLGNVLLQGGKLQEARQQYEQALRIEPFLAEPYNNLGTILIQSGRLQDAIRQYRQALQVKLDYPEAQNNLGAALLRAGNVEEAMPHIAAAVQLNPNYVEARYNYAVLLANQGRMDEAISQLQSALKLQPDRAEFHRKLDELERLKAQR